MSLEFYVHIYPHMKRIRIWHTNFYCAIRQSKNINTETEHPFYFCSRCFLDFAFLFAQFNNAKGKKKQFFLKEMIECEQQHELKYTRKKTTNTFDNAGINDKIRTLNDVLTVRPNDRHKNRLGAHWLAQHWKWHKSAQIQIHRYFVSRRQKNSKECCWRCYYSQFFLSFLLFLSYFNSVDTCLHLSASNLFIIAAIFSYCSKKYFQNIFLL